MQSKAEKIPTKFKGALKYQSMTIVAEWSTNSRSLEILFEKRKQSRSHFPWRKIMLLIQTLSWPKSKRQMLRFPPLRVTVNHKNCKQFT